MKTNLKMLVGAAAVLLSGCHLNMDSRNTHATSVIQFLYPNDMKHQEAPGLPVLRLPLRVGIAFVPSAQSYSAGLSEMSKAQILKRVADEFKGLPYVASIETIPTSYLQPGGGFENLEQLKNMYQIDVMALVSYDQVQLTHEGVLSLAYWTIVGAYIVQGERNDTQTLMDTVVVDIQSRKMLFRAPGTSEVKASATPVNLYEELALNSRKGFDEATTVMITNLKTELDAFRERVKQSPDQFKVENRPGYTGGGATGAVESMALAALALCALRRKPACPSVEKHLG